MDRTAFYNAIRPAFGGSLSQEQVDGCEALLAVTDGMHICERAYILATARHETAHTMQPITEYGRISYFQKYDPGTRIGRTLGNTHPGDGYRFRGRGYVQITGRSNYARASEKLGVDLIGDPDRALHPAVAGRIIRIGMSEGWFTSKKLSDYLPGDYVGARRIVNGTDKAKTIAGYAKQFEAALDAAQDAAPVIDTPIIHDDPQAPSGGLWAALAAWVMGMLKK